MSPTDEQAKHQRPNVYSLLPIRQFLDGVMVRTDGSYVAGYHLAGKSTDESVQEAFKILFPAVSSCLPEKIVRAQYRIERNKSNLSISVYLIWNARQYANRVSTPVEEQQPPQAERSFTRFARHIYDTIIAPFSVTAQAKLGRSKHLSNVEQFSTFLTEQDSVFSGLELPFTRLNSEDLLSRVNSAIGAKDNPSGRANDLPRVEIIEEAEEYLNVGGYLYGCITLWTAPKAGDFGDIVPLLAEEIPGSISINLAIMDRTEAQLRPAQLGVSIVFSAPQKATSQKEYEAAELQLANYRRTILERCAKRGLEARPETLAKQRIWLAALPGLAAADDREIDLLLS
jgi:hypothetical protein